MEDDNKLKMRYAISYLKLNSGNLFESYTDEKLSMVINRKINLSKKII